MSTPKSFPSLTVMIRFSAQGASLLQLKGGRVLESGRLPGTEHIFLFEHYTDLTAIKRQIF